MEWTLERVQEQINNIKAGVSRFYEKIILIYYRE